MLFHLLELGVLFLDLLELRLYPLEEAEVASVWAFPLECQVVGCLVLVVAAEVGRSRAMTFHSVQTLA